MDGAALSTLPDTLPEADGGLVFLQRLGEGALGEVFSARAAAGRLVAVKRLKLGPSKSPTLRERFLREARLASRIDSPHVVVVHDVIDRDQPLLVMELVDGPTLSALAASAPLAHGEVAAIAVDLARALAAAHASGVLHRDVKPANVLVARGSSAVKLADFGLARVLGDDRLTATGEMLGTPRYLAPEAALGKAEAASDLYSMGCVLYEILAGRPPFVGTVREVLAAHASAAPATLGSDALSSLIDALLRKSPAARPTASDVVAALT